METNTIRSQITPDLDSYADYHLSDNWRPQTEARLFTASPSSSVSENSVESHHDSPSTTQSAETTEQSEEAIVHNICMTPGPITGDSIPDNDPSKLSPVAPCSWTPFWLSTPILIVFSCIFTVLLLATVVLYHLSVLNQGLSTQSPDFYYSWKYGPTAVLVIVNALWTKIDFTIKISMPWKELQDKPESLQQSIHLDYISPILPILILAATAISTGLLNLESTEIAKERTDFHQKSELQLPENWVSAGLSNGLQPVAGYTYVGIHQYGLPAPPGTSEDTIIPAIEVPGATADTLCFKTQATGLRTEFECDALPTHNITVELIGSNTYYFIDVDIGGCAMTNATIAKHQYPQLAVEYGNFAWYPCNTNYSLSIGSEPKRTDTDGRLFVAEAEMKREKGGNAGHENPPKVVNYTAVVCKASYFTGTFEIQGGILVGGPQAGRLSSISATPTQVGSQLQGLSSSKLGQVVLDQIRATILTEMFDDWTFPALLSLIGQQPYLAYLQPELLSTTASRILSGVATQLLHDLAVQPASLNITGQTTKREHRLKVSKHSTIILSIIFGALVILPLFLLRFRAPHNLAVAPDSIAAMAFAIASHPILGKESIQQRHLAASEKKRKGSPKKTNSHFFRGHSSTKPMKQPPASLPADNDGSEPSYWWRPIASKNWFFAVTVAFSLSLIAILETLQHLSAKQSGIVKLSQSNTPIYTTYAPTALALTIAALYSSLVFATSLLTPYTTLSHGKANTTQALSFSCLGKLFPHAIYSAYKSRHYAIIMAMLGSFFGGFLTIIASGLFTTLDTVQLTNSSLMQSETFNFSSAESLYRNEVINLASLIEYKKMTFPRWTYQNLAIGKLIQGNSTQTYSHATSLSITVPAVRPRLNCSSVVISKWKVSAPNDRFSDDPIDDGHINLILDPNLKAHDWCEEPLLDSMPDNLFLPEDYHVPVNGEVTYIGSTQAHTYPMPTCPNVFLTPGTARVSRSVSDGNQTTHNVQLDLGTLVCYSNFEKLNVTLTFTLPNFELDSSHPPLIDESSVEVLLNEEGSPRFHVGLLGAVSELDRMTNYDDTMKGETSLPILKDAFLRTIMYGRNNRTIEELAGENNTANLLAAANGVYGRYVAQLLSQESRTNAASLIVYEGTIESNGGKSLHQNTTSKLILQILLAIMIICAISSKLLMPTTKVLLHNPCSIYGVTSLLISGSVLSRRLDLSAEHRNHDPKTILKDLFGGDLYTLKWWTSDSEQRHYGIDVDNTGD
ncbi:hypothetical protein HJFPF1_13094 [Paramyrothecium foliicola]|nr:hypothetical protein HJFPF1_13094 [Paramyrothecium foliicola]